MMTMMTVIVLILIMYVMMLCDDEYIYIMIVALAADITPEENLLTVCPGELVSLTCTHDISDRLTRWQVNGPISCDRLLLHGASEIQEDNCGPFTITMISNTSGSTLSSTIHIIATEALDSSVVTCLAGIDDLSPQVGNTTLNVIGKY